MKKLTLQQTLELNKAQRRSEVNARIRFERKEQRKEAIIIYSTIAFVVALTIMSMFNYNDKAIKSCVDAGNNETYCVRKLG